MVKERHVCDGDSRLKFLKPELVSGYVCATLSMYDKSRNRIEISENGRYVLHEQRVYATHELGSEREMMSFSLLIWSESDEEKETWVKKVLLLFCCVVGVNKKDDDRTCVPFMECVLPPDAVDGAL